MCSRPQTPPHKFKSFSKLFVFSFASAMCTRFGSQGQRATAWRGESSPCATHSQDTSGSRYKRQTAFSVYRWRPFVSNWAHNHNKCLTKWQNERIPFFRSCCFFFFFILTQTEHHEPRAKTSKTARNFIRINIYYYSFFFFLYCWCCWCRSLDVLVVNVTPCNQRDQIHFGSYIIPFLPLRTAHTNDIHRKAKREREWKKANTSPNVVYHRRRLRTLCWHLFLF